MDMADTLRQAVDGGDVPGVAATAATADGTIFEGAAGALKPDSVIWIASMTKAITGAAAMQMVEQGKFGLDTPAAEVVPEIARKEVLLSIGADGAVKTRPARKPITLRHLLTHTSGMGYDTWDADIFRYVQAKGPLKPNSMEMLSTPLLADPGERWEYSISIDWAGLMVEAAGGVKLDRYMKDNLFDPLKMADTGFRIGPAMRPRKAAVRGNPVAQCSGGKRSAARKGAGVSFLELSADRPFVFFRHSTVSAASGLWSARRDSARGGCAKQWQWTLRSARQLACRVHS